MRHLGPIRLISMYPLDGSRKPSVLVGEPRETRIGDQSIGSRQLSIDATTMQEEKGTFSRGHKRYPTIAISAVGSESERTDCVGAYHRMN